MALGSTVAKNAVLDATLGGSVSSAIPALLYLAFFNGDPSTTGVELASTGGYARIAVSTTGTVWGAAASAIKSNSAAVQSGVSTGAYASAITHVAFFDAASAGSMWDYGALGSTVTVTASNQVVRFAAGAIQITQA